MLVKKSENDIKRSLRNGRESDRYLRAGIKRWVHAPPQPQTLNFDSLDSTSTNND